MLMLAESADLFVQEAEDYLEPSRTLRAGMPVKPQRPGAK